MPFRARSLLRLVLAGSLAVAACGGANDAAGPKPPRPANPNPRPPLGAEPPAPDGIAGEPWLEALHARIAQRWSEGFLESCRVGLPNEHPLNDPKLEAKISLTIAPDGRLTAMAMTTSSGNTEYDAAVMEVMRDVGDQLPPTPRSLRGDDELVHIGWTFARDERQAGLAGVTVDRQLWAIEKAVPLLVEQGNVDDALRRLAGAPEQASVELSRLVAGAIVARAFAPETEAGARVAAVRAAGRGGLLKVAPTLIELARADRDLAVRVAAIDALGELRHAPAAPLLLEIVAGLDGERSAAAAAALVKLDKGADAWSRIAPKLGEPASRSAALIAAGQLGAPGSTQALAAVLNDAKAPRTERVLAADALGAVGGRPGGEAALKALAPAAIAGDAALRAAAAGALAKAGVAGGRSRSVAYKLVPLLKDKDPRVQAAGITAAGLLGGDPLARELVTLAGREQPDAIREAIAAGLGSGTTPAVLTTLKTLASDKIPAVRARALGVLATRKEADAQALVAAQTSDPDPALRVLAIRAQTDARVAALGLTDETPAVRAAALEVTVKLGGPTGAMPQALAALGAEPVGLRVAAAEGWLAATK